VSDDLAWLPGSVEAPLLDAVHRVVGAVMRLGGAVGWVDVPDRAETAGWLAGIAAEVAAGRTRMALLELDGRVAALGRWTRYAKDTVAVNAVIMMQAGHETTANMISLGTVALLEHPDVFELLGQTDDAAVIARAVEELMRYLTIVHAQVDRIALEDLTIGGQLIRAGERVLMNLPAGNWDTEFADDPEKFDIQRNVRGHLAFGYGAHQCIGANLARVEMQVAFSSLARRLPGLRLAVPADQLRYKYADIYGMKELPVTW